MLGFWLTSVGINISGLLLLVNAISKRAKREGYIEIKKKKSISENLIIILQTAPNTLIPIWNLLFVVVGIAKFENLYKDYIENSLSDVEYMEVSIRDVKEIKKFVFKDKIKDNFSNEVIQY